MPQVLLIALLLLSSQTLGMSRSEEVRAIGLYFGESIPSQIVSKQDFVLLSEFSGRFKKRSDLTAEDLSLYIREYPSQLLPVREYLQNLIDVGFISSGFAMSALEQSVKGLVSDANSPVKPNFNVIRGVVAKPKELPSAVPYEMPESTNSDNRVINAVERVADDVRSIQLRNSAQLMDQTTATKSLDQRIRKVEQDQNSQIEEINLLTGAVADIAKDIIQVKSESQQDKVKLGEITRKVNEIVAEVNSVVMTSLVFQSDIAGGIRANADAVSTDIAMHRDTVDDLLDQIRELKMQTENLKLQASDNQLRVTDLQDRTVEIVDKVLMLAPQDNVSQEVTKEINRDVKSITKLTEDQKIGSDQLSRQVETVSAKISETEEILVMQQQNLLYAEQDNRPKEMPMAQTLAVEAGRTLSSANPSKTVQTKARVKVSKVIEEKSRQKLLNLFDNARVSVDFGDAPSSIDVTVLKASDDDGQKNQFPFTQFGINAYDGRTTLNLGGGYRVLSDDELWMLGGNVFYDHEFPDGHQRGSVGVEFVSSPFRVNANRYFGISGYKSDKDGGEAKPVGGYDIKADVALPYFPGAFLTLNQFKWEGEDGASDLKGTDYGLKGNLTDQVSVEIYRRNYDSDSISDQTRANINYEWRFGQDTTPFYQMASTPYVVRPVKLDRYRLVERENRIIKQKKSALTVSAL